MTEFEITACRQGLWRGTWRRREGTGFTTLRPHADHAATTMRSPAFSPLRTMKRYRAPEIRTCLAAPPCRLDGIDEGAERPCESRLGITMAFGQTMPVSFTRTNWPGSRAPSLWETRRGSGSCRCADRWCRERMSILPSLERPRRRELQLDLDGLRIEQPRHSACRPPGAGAARFVKVKFT